MQLYVTACVFLTAPSHWISICFELYDVRAFDIDPFVLVYFEHVGALFVGFLCYLLPICSPSSEVPGHLCNFDKNVSWNNWLYFVLH